MDLDVEQGYEQPEFVNQVDAPSDDLTNNIVTVSLLQVALRAEARRMQVTLNEFAETADTTTSDGLFELLQQSSRLLLDYSRYWTHVFATSQTVNSIEEAEALYNRLLNQERSKFNVETLSNVNGQVRRQPAIARGNPEQPAYIVVTLLMGTADDQPLFDEIYSASMLRDTLDNIRFMQPRYLLILETLWTPQDPNDSLTEAELAADYENLSAIA
ncbi:MAG: DUF1517 domain-containing protein [Leptolyngbyaceae cyanobacterium bins.349]|nr:DUF1517 domain-containing protein [Leptolyngbyaceae cyanobacterium bins.349]